MKICYRRTWIVMARTSKKIRRQIRRDISDKLYEPPIVSYDYTCVMVHVSVRSSRIEKAGDGLFANEDIPEGTCIGEYTGERRSLTNLCISSYSFDLGDGFYIDALSYPRAVTAMVNDSRNLLQGGLLYPYNCEFKVQKICGQNRCFLYSVRDINAGDELYVDYGPDYWKNR